MGVEYFDSYCMLLSVDEIFANFFAGEDKKPCKAPGSKYALIEVMQLCVWQCEGANCLG